MVAWYAGEGNNKDIQGPTFENGSNGGSPAVGFNTGKVGQAFSFTGTNFVTMGNVGPLFISNDKVTIDGWIKPNTANPGGHYFGKALSGGHDYAVFHSNGVVNGVIRTSSGGETTLAPGYTPPIGTWTHLALTYDGAFVRLYANGVQIDAVAKTGSIASVGAPFNIGGRQDGFDFNGQVDEVEVFTRALAPTEIADIYNAGVNGKCKHGLIQFSAPTYTVGEAGVNATITVTRTDGGVGAASVHYATSDGTATASDYTARSGDLNWADGDVADKTFTIPINDDGIYESNETVNLTLSAATGGQLGPHATAVLTITDNDTAPTFSIDDVTKAEGNAGTTSFTFTVSKTGDTEVAATVNFATANGTVNPAVGGASCGPGIDYVSQTGSLSFPASGAGALSQTITIAICGDTSIESDETFKVLLSNPADATISDGEGLGTIVNDDTDVSVTISSPSSVPEDGAQNLTYTFTRNPQTSGAITVNFSVSGTASSADDYSVTGASVTFDSGTNTGTVTIANGETTVTVTPTPDNVTEPDETVTLTVTSGPGYNVGSPTAATGTIVNDDTSVTVTVSPASVAEDGTANLVYTFTRNPVLSGPKTVAFSVGGTATFNTDYTVSGADTFSSSSGTVTFADGSNTATVTVDPTSDNVFESNETVILTVGSGTGYSAGTPGAATGTITNDDAAPTLTIGDRIASEGDSGTTNFVFTVTKNGSTELPVTVNFATADGTTNPATGGATCGSGTDYISQNGVLTFPATGTGSTSQTITIGVCGDTQFEPNETFFVELSGETNATISDGEGRGTIQNDDAAPPLSPVNTTDDVNDGAFAMRSIAACAKRSTRPMPARARSRLRSRSRPATRGISIMLMTVSRTTSPTIRRM